MAEGTPEPVDVSRSTASALTEGERWAQDDHMYAELMYTLAELGELLDAEQDEDWESDVRALTLRAFTLDVAVDHQTQQTWALWYSGNTRAA